MENVVTWIVLTAWNLCIIAAYVLSWCDDAIRAQSDAQIAEIEVIAANSAVF